MKRLPILGLLALSISLLQGGTPTPRVPAGDGPAGPRMDVLGKDGAPMVLVPAGEFLMGSADTDPLGHFSEKPQRRVAVPGFYIDRYEVTVAQYDQFLADIKEHGHVSCAPDEPKSWSHLNTSAGKPVWSSPTRPVVNVSWYDAAAYCAWAGERLPTEEEWEKAARGADGRIYPWGNEPPDARLLGNFADEASVRRPGSTPNNAGTWVEGLNDRFGGSAPVGSFEAGASPYGAEDMAGNVQEWVATRFNGDLRGAEGTASARDAAGNSWAITRGGSFKSFPRNLRAASRERATLREKADDLGFRCAVSEGASVRCVRPTSWASRSGDALTSAGS